MKISDSLGRAVRSPAFKFVVVCILILALMIPLMVVWALSSERSSYARTAKSDVGRMWGRPQVVRGPFIVLPVIQNKEVRRNNRVEIEKVRKLAVLLPEKLNLEADVKTEELKRGIFKIPVYRSTLNFSGTFVKPDLTRIMRQANEAVWDDAVLVVTLSDVRGIKKSATVSLGSGRGEQTFRPGVGVESGNVRGIHIPLNEAIASDGFDFSFSLALNGSAEMGYAPVGGNTVVEAKSDWPHPSFYGSFLPETRKIDENGFEARWVIPKLARGTGQAFVATHIGHLLSDSVFHVRFFQPLDYYSLVDRSLKYALAFIAIVFLAVFVMEIQSRKRVHWIQYIFVGLALIIFYLVLLGLSEHIGFEPAYAIATFATAGLIGLYASSAFRSSFKGGIMAAILVVIYGLLYLLLRVEDYAMLIGSIAAFVLLAIVMFATRNVDWGRTVEDEAKSG